MELLAVPKPNNRIKHGGCGKVSVSPNPCTDIVMSAEERATPVVLSTGRERGHKKKDRKKGW
jgi:hypothetical protein